MGLDLHNATIGKSRALLAVSMSRSRESRFYFLYILELKSYLLVPQYLLSYQEDISPEHNVCEFSHQMWRLQLTELYANTELPA